MGFDYQSHGPTILLGPITDDVSRHYVFDGSSLFEMHAEELKIY